MTFALPLLIAAALTPAEAPPEPVGDWVQSHAFNGVVRLDTGDRGQSWAWGVADPETGRLINADTRFQTGSIDKYFASIAVFALVDEGVLDLDAPISAYLHDYRPDTGAQLTLRMILSNQSGLPNDLRAAFRRIANGEAEAVDAQSVDEAVADYASGDLQFQPGERFDYALSNWLLVQYLLAEVTGESYVQVRQHYVYDRAGMSQSGGYVHDLHETTPRVRNVAIGFDPEDPDGRGDYWSPDFFKGSYTTASDLIRLERALESGEVLSAASLEAFRTVQVPEQNYAYGGRFRELELCGASYLVSTQSGSNGASNITLVYVPAFDAGMAMLTNVDESQGEMFALSYQLLQEQVICAD
ncbi:serine hydrolase domain-containing protein [Oceanicaulis sp. LC35]|uniref:serine hydrolase domain-containing protein n=1 Tax=Oceanicaulis sp. LC35 TaxID=3349635 RepID=UPI003F869E25